MRCNSSASGRREQVAGLLHRLVQPARAEIIRAALEHREVELHRSGSAPSTPASIGRSFSVSCSCRLIVCVRDDRLPAVGDGEQNRRDEIREALADARARLDRQMLPLLERPRHRHGHLLLLRAILEVLRARQHPVGEKISSTCSTRSAPKPAGCDSMMLIMDCLWHCGRRRKTRLTGSVQDVVVEVSRALTNAATQNSYFSLGLRTTTSTAALFLAIMFAGRMPRQLTFG